MFALYTLQTMTTHGSGGSEDHSSERGFSVETIPAEEAQYPWAPRGVSGTTDRAECVQQWISSPGGKTDVLSGRLKTEQLIAMAEIGDDFDLTTWEIARGLLETFLERKHMEYSQPRRDIPGRARNLLRGMENVGLLQIREGTVEDFQEAVMFAVFDEFLNIPEVLEYAVEEAKAYWTTVHSIAIGQTQNAARFAEGVDPREFLRLDLEDFGWMLMLERSANKTVNWRQELFDWKPRTPEKQRYVLMILEQIRDRESDGWDFLLDRSDLTISVPDSRQRISLDGSGYLKKPYTVEKRTKNHRKSGNGVKPGE